MTSWLRRLYVQVFVAIVLGGLVGVLAPDVAVTLQPLADSVVPGPQAAPQAPVPAALAS